MEQGEDLKRHPPNHQGMQNPDVLQAVGGESGGKDETRDFFPSTSLIPGSPRCCPGARGEGRPPPLPPAVAPLPPPPAVANSSSSRRSSRSGTRGSGRRAANGLAAPGPSGSHWLAAAPAVRQAPRAAASCARASPAGLGARAGARPPPRRAGAAGLRPGRRPGGRGAGLGKPRLLLRSRKHLPSRTEPLCPGRAKGGSERLQVPAPGWGGFLPLPFPAWANAPLGFACTGR